MRFFRDRNTAAIERLTESIERLTESIDRLTEALNTQAQPPDLSGQVKSVMEMAFAPLMAMQGNTEPKVQVDLKLKPSDKPGIRKCL